MGGASTWDLDVAVIGAGPAGLAAGMMASELGLEVAVLDEQPRPGGQIYREIETTAARKGESLALLGADYGAGLELVTRFRAAGVDYRPGTSVFDIAPEGGLGVVAPDGARWVKAKRIIIATGAMERPPAVPGWTLPGVMGAGAAQTLLKSTAMAPSGRTVVAGSGPLLYLVARQLLAAGASIAAVLETTPRANYLRAAPWLPGALVSLGDLRKGLAWRREIKQSGLPFLTGVRDIRIDGDGRVESIAFQAGRRAHRLECDLLLLHEGVVPNVQLSMAVGAEHAFDMRQACWRPRLDAYGRSSVETVLVAGDGGGIRGADVAAQAGVLSALAAAADLGTIDAGEAEARAALPLIEIRRKAPLRRFLDVLYRPREEVLVPAADETIVCRCEEVTAGELRRVAAMGCRGPNQAKTYTRCGMGPCQARMCGLTSAAVLANANGLALGQAGYLRIRPPIKPITVGELADMEGIGAPPAAGPLLPTGGDREADA
ncbi:MAG: FAD-dependent oxidoreductase [Kiloniellales bacterium]|nr:FAD-dependent oxidoreductase [Kiloniellales bacterium]